MAYRSYLKAYGAGAQNTIMADMSTYMQAMGWTLFDNISATNHVLSSNGEDGAKDTEYLNLYVSGTTIYLYCYVYWDTAAHSGAGQGSTYATAVTFVASAANTLRLYGDKDMVFWQYGTAVRGVGHIPYKAVSSPLTTLSAPAASGLNVVLSVGSTNDFQVGNKAQLVDFSTGCRELVTINNIKPGVSVTAASLANGYAAGAKIGYSPSLFGVLYSNSFYYTCIPSVSGTEGVGGSSGSKVDVAAMLIPTVPDVANNAYGIVPMRFGNSVNHGYAGFTKEPFLAHSSAAGTIFMVCNAGNSFENGTATAGGTALMDDAGKAWADDSLIGKILVLTTGTGAGQSRYITDNTGTRIVVGQGWATNPIAGTGYTICDKAYFALNTLVCCKEMIGQP